MEITRTAGPLYGYNFTMSMGTRSAGVRELRDNLSAHLALVKKGETIVVTEHGRPVATLAPYSSESPLARMLEQGIARPPVSRRRRNLPPPVPAAGSIVELIAEQR